MCRMMYMQGAQPSLRILKTVEHGLRHWSRMNDDGTGLMYQTDDGQLWTYKGALKAVDFFKDAKVPITRRMGGHVRAATSGKICYEDSHPFASCDGKWLLMHNGILSGYDTVRADLIKKGHNFKGSTDSEVMLHVLEDIGDPSKLIETLRDLGIRGQANLIIMSKDATYAISDGSITLLRFKHGNVAVASDDVPWISKHGQHVSSGKMLMIPADVTLPIIETTVGSLPSGYATAYAYYNGYEGYEGGAAWTNRGTGKHWRLTKDGSFTSGYDMDNEEKREMSDSVQSREKDHEEIESELQREINEAVYGTSEPQWADEEEERIDRAIASWESNRIRELREADEREEFEKVATGLTRLFGEGGSAYCKNCDIKWDSDSYKNNKCPTCQDELYSVHRE